MGLRQMLGLCAHRWELTGERMSTWRTRYNRVTPSKSDEVMIATRDVCRCANCGAIKSFRL